MPGEFFVNPTAAEYQTNLVPKTDTSPSPLWRLAFPVFLALTFLLFWTPLRTLLALVLRDEHYSHIALIPFIAAALIYRNRRQVFQNSRLSPAWGLPLLVAALAVCYIAPRLSLSAANGLSLLIAGLVLVWIAGFVLCYGPESFKAALFPLLFLVLMVPVPPVLLGKIVSLLQTGSAEGTSVLFSVLHVPAFRDGFRFTVPHFTIEIAQQCSSIRSGTALFITGLLAGHLFLGSNMRRIVLSLATVPIAMFTNAVRIVTLTCLAVYVDPGFLFGSLHHSGGAAFSLISVVVLLAVLFLLRRSETRREGGMQI